MLSIIIPAYNEEELLPATLSAARQAIADSGISCEIIVADDRSSDQTAQIAREMSVTVCHANCRQIAGARNAGARAAKGDVFLFVDADTLITSESLIAVHDAIEQGATGGGTKIEFDRPCPLWARLMIKPMMILYPLLGLASGAFLYCTRDAFEKIGGFDESYYAAEEAILSRAIGKHGRFVFLKTPVVTSSRKIRTYSGFEMIRLIMIMLVGGHRWAKSRKGKGIWYDERRSDTKQD